MDEREILLGELLAAALAALEARRFAEVDAIIDRAEAADRQELLDMIELALTLRGPAQLTPETMQELAAEPMFDVRGWDEILEPARHALGMKRPALITQLAERLGIRDEAGRGRLTERYHELETGRLAPARVQPVLRDALGDLLGGIGATLTATRLNPTGPSGPALAFNRPGAEIAGIDALGVGLPDETTDSERLVDDLFGV